MRFHAIPSRSRGRGCGKRGEARELVYPIGGDVYARFEEQVIYTSEKLTMEILTDEVI